jgi:hypothetical protein
LGKTALFEIESTIDAVEKDPSVYEERNFARRVEAIDFIESQALEQIERWIQLSDQPKKLNALRQRAENVMSELERINSALFRKLQETVRAGEYRGQEFKDLVHALVHPHPGYAGDHQEPGYDNVDILVNGLFSFQDAPVQIKDLEPEMVYYQKTPARIIFELVEKAHITESDVFFDLGSGWGQAVVLVNLLAGITSFGVEFEPAFCHYARACASGLNLFNTVFINTDARRADYSKGTIFFMFTPFKGEMLQEVLTILRKESLLRKIKIITYGPCTTEAAAQSWLRIADTGSTDPYKLGVFTSF